MPTRENNITRSGASMAVRPSESNVQRRTFQHAVPQYRGNAEGIGALADSMRGFYKGMSGALERVAGAEHAIEMDRIRKENEQQAKTGAAAAMTDAPLPAELANDLDAAHAYERAAASRDALRDYDDFKKVVADADPGVPFEELKRTFLEERFGKGSISADYNLQYLDAFNKGAATVQHARTSQQIENLKKQKLQTTKDGLAASTALGHFADPITLAQTIDQFATVNGGDVVAARSLAMDTITAASNTPALASKLLATLDAPGYGPNGESYFQLFPDARNTIGNKLTAVVEQNMPFELAQVLQDYEVKIDTNPDFFSDPVNNAMAMEQLHAAQYYQGGGKWIRQLQNKLETLRGKWIKGMQKQVEADASLRMMDAIFHNEPGAVGLRDPEAFNANADAWLKRHGVRADYLADPTQTKEAIGLFRGLGYIPPAHLQMIASAALDPTNPEAQAAAVEGLRTLDAYPGGSLLQDIPQHTRALLNVVDSLAAQGLPTQLVLARFTQDPDLIKRLNDPKGHDYSRLIGKPDAAPDKARNEIRARTTKGLAESLGVDAGAVPSMELDRIQEQVVLTARYLEAAGYPDALDQAISAHGRTLAKTHQLVPGPGGTLRLEKPTHDVDVRRGELGWGVYPNPRTGAKEDTRETYRESAKDIARMLPTRMGDPRAVEVRPFADGQTARTGHYMVADAQGPIIFGRGDMVDVRELVYEETRGPETFDEASGMVIPATTVRHENKQVSLTGNFDEDAHSMRRYLPPGYEVFPYTMPNGDVAMALAYKPRFTDRVEARAPTMVFRTSDIPEAARGTYGRFKDLRSTIRSAVGGE